MLEGLLLMKLILRGWGNGNWPKRRRTKRYFVNHILGKDIILVRGLVKFVPAADYNFYLNLAVAFPQPHISIMDPVDTFCHENQNLQFMAL